MTKWQAQALLFPSERDSALSRPITSNFTANMRLPVHRWFRYSAGFSAEWVETVIKSIPGKLVVFDPFAGSATTLLSAERAGVESWGLEAHPFVYRVARAKLLYRSDPRLYLRKIEQLKSAGKAVKPDLDGYPALIRKYSLGS